MSYDDHPSTFNGTFRSLDWMTLTKFYGVNPTFRSGDDIYTFNDATGVFIIDGNGIDTISEPHSTANIFIDLRSGSHNYEGYKSIFITDPKAIDHFAWVRDGKCPYWHWRGHNNWKSSAKYFNFWRWG